MGTLLKSPMSRADLARKIGLTRAAITIIVDSMITEGLVSEKGTVANGLGRNPVILEVNPDGRYALGLNIARSSCSLGLVNIKGEVLSSESIDIKDAANATQAIEIIRGEIDKMLEKTDFDKDKLIGMGITAPGPLSCETGTILSPPNFEMWENANIVSEFKKSFSFDINLENNASALALAEKNYGHGRNFSDFILIVVDSGIGAGIVTKGALYKGANSLGAEIGHSSIDYNGTPCSCGNRGCLEVYASIPAIIKKAQITRPDIGTWKEIVDGADKGDAFCVDIISEEAKYLAASIVNSVNILGIEAVILSGYVTYKPDLLLEKLKSQVNAMAINRSSFETAILASGIANHTEIVASSSVVFESIV